MTARLYSIAEKARLKTLPQREKRQNVAEAVLTAWPKRFARLDPLNTHNITLSESKVNFVTS
jgi:hypothetical protein